MEILANARGVAHSAALALEDLLPSLRNRIELVRIRRRLQRTDIKCQSVKLLIAVPA
jgi:hypothetical protein